MPALDRLGVGAVTGSGGAGDAHAVGLRHRRRERLAEAAAVPAPALRRLADREVDQLVEQRLEQVARGGSRVDGDRQPVLGGDGEPLGPPRPLRRAADRQLGRVVAIRPLGPAERRQRAEPGGLGADVEAVDAEVGSGSAGHGARNLATAPESALRPAAAPARSRAATRGALAGRA